MRLARNIVSAAVCVIAAAAFGVLVGACGNETDNLTEPTKPPTAVLPDIGHPGAPDAHPAASMELNRMAALGYKPRVGIAQPVDTFPAHWPRKPINEWTLADARSAMTRRIRSEVTRALEDAAYIVNPAMVACSNWWEWPSGHPQFRSGTHPPGTLGNGECRETIGNARFHNLSTHPKFYASGAGMNDNIRSFTAVAHQDTHTGIHRCISVRVYQGPAPSVPPEPGAIGINNGTGLVIDRWGCSNYAGPGAFMDDVKAQPGWEGWDGVTAISVDYWEI